MKKTIIAGIVALVCTAAICLTYAFASPEKESEKSTTVYPAYMTEEQAADYIGVTDDVIKLMRVNLKYLDGSFVSYTYTDKDGKEVTDVVYNKAALDKAVAKLMEKNSALNFKYVQQVAEKSDKK